MTCNPENERLKRLYFAYLKEAKRFSEASLDATAAALHRFEVDTNFRSFKTFRIEQAVAFKRHLAEQMSATTGKPLSKATMYATLSALRNFFHWLAGQPGFRSRLSYSDAEYFNLSEKETRIAKAHREPRIPTVEQILHVLHSMPATTEIERRNRTLIAFTLLTGARDGAIASLKLKHVDMVEGLVMQDAREVNTKLSKTFPTWFFPVGDEVRGIVAEWVEFLKTEKRWGLDDPLFPATLVTLGPDHQFRAVGLDRKHWTNAGPIRAIFKEAFTAAGLPYFNPHSFRRTLVLLGEQLCGPPEEFKAWSQNLGHEKVMTTLFSYGEVAARRQAEIMRGLGKKPTKEEDIVARMRQLLDSAR